MTKKTECVYLEMVKLKLVKILKNKSPNIHEITLEISPPLYVFSTLTAQQIEDLFILPIKFLGVSIQYDSATGELVIDFMIDEDILTDKFYLDIDFLSVGIDKYFAIDQKRL